MRGVGNEGEREVRKTGSVPKNTEGRSSFSDVQRRIVAVGFGTRGVERRTKMNAQSHGMRCA